MTAANRRVVALVVLFACGASAHASERRSIRCLPQASAGHRSDLGSAPRNPSRSIYRHAESATVQSADVSRLLAAIKAADTDLLAVSQEDGQFLRTMVIASGAKQALEIGGANGYSAIWIGLGLRETGGRLTSIEYDPARAKIEAENIRQAGLADVVTVIPGDAFKAIPQVAGTFDFVFLDAWKRDYERFYDMVFPRVRLHGVFLAHNVVNKQAEMRDFLAAIQNSPDAVSSIVKPSGEGMSVTVKVKP